MKAKIPSISTFAAMPDAFEHPKGLLRRLRVETSESKHLEWKLTPPIGSCVTLRTKYKVAKAIISFANTHGGFVVFGISDKGEWIGFEKIELLDTDAAKIYELVNGCVSPDIEALNFSILKFRNRFFPVVHVPPSAKVPHVTTKEIAEQKKTVSGGRTETHLNKNTVYCRYGAKCDHANATHFERIVNYRAEQIKTELLRKVKEIDVSIIVPKKANPKKSSGLRIVKQSDDPTMPAVRITRDPTESSGVYVQEEISEHLFEDINQVLKTNTLLASNREEFILGEEIYYRVYAEREYVDVSQLNLDVLVMSAMCKYTSPAPLCYWLLKMSPSQVAAFIHEVLESKKGLPLHQLTRFITLLGDGAMSWMDVEFSKLWQNHPQPPEYYFSLHKMIRSVQTKDRRLDLHPKN